MLKKDVVVGGRYITNQNREIKIVEEVKSVTPKGATLTQWDAINLATNRRIRIKSAAKLKRQIPHNF